MTILYSSLSATVLIAVIALVRRAALHRLPKNTFRVLWIGAALRLLLPFSVEFQYSFFTLVHTLLRKNSGDLPFSPIVLEETRGEIGRAAHSLFSIPEVLWLAGFCVMTGFFLTSYIRSMGKFRHASPVSGAYAQSLPIKQPPHVRVRLCERIPAPLTYGIFHPVILPPHGVDWDDRETLSMILAHEYTHIRRHDCLVKLLFTAALCVHWFNPAVWLLCRLANWDIELACDEKTIRSMGEDSRFSYARVLLCQAEKTPGVFQLFSHFGKHGVEERVISALKQRRQSVWRGALACLLVAGTLAVFGTGAARGLDAGPKPSSGVLSEGEPWISVSFCSDAPADTFDQLKLTTPEGEPYPLKAQQCYTYQLNQEAFKQGVVNGQVTERTLQGEYLFLTNASAELCLISQDPMIYQIGKLTVHLTGGDS